MEYKDYSAAEEEMAELSETIKNICNNYMHEDNMAVSYVTATNTYIHEVYDKEYWIKPIFTLEKEIFDSHEQKLQEFITHKEIYKSIDDQLPVDHLKCIKCKGFLVKIG